MGHIVLERHSPVVLKAFVEHELAHAREVIESVTAKRADGSLRAADTSRLGDIGDTYALYLAPGERSVSGEAFLNYYERRVRSAQRSGEVPSDLQDNVDNMLTLFAQRHAVSVSERQAKELVLAALASCSRQKEDGSYRSFDLEAPLSSIPEAAVSALREGMARVAEQIGETVGRPEAAFIAYQPGGTLAPVGYAVFFVDAYFEGEYLVAVTGKGEEIFSGELI